MYFIPLCYSVAFKILHLTNTFITNTLFRVKEIVAHCLAQFACLPIIYHITHGRTTLSSVANNDSPGRNKPLCFPHHCHSLWCCHTPTGEQIHCGQWSHRSLGGSFTPLKFALGRKHLDEDKSQVMKIPFGCSLEIQIPLWEEGFSCWQPPCFQPFRPEDSGVWGWGDVLLLWEGALDGGMKGSEGWLSLRGKM